MRVYSWNMFYRNKRPLEALAFIRSSPFDVFCLQEVPETILAELQMLPFHLVFRRDMEKLHDSGDIVMYNVILSKYPIRASKEIPFRDYLPFKRLRTKLFVRFMLWNFPQSRNRGGLYADIDVLGTPVRIMNLHLILIDPELRLAEFEQALSERGSSLPTIVCGDLNILEKPHITVLNWLLGASLSHALLYRRERAIIERRFAEEGLQNPLKGKATHDLSRSQLDHILPSDDFTISRSEVIADRHGSDHHPVFAEVALGNGTERARPR